MGIALQSILVNRGVIKLTVAALTRYYKAHQSDYRQAGATSFEQAKSEVEQDYAKAATTPCSAGSPPAPPST